MICPVDVDLPLMSASVFVLDSLDPDRSASLESVHARLSTLPGQFQNVLLVCHPSWSECCANARDTLAVQIEDVLQVGHLSILAQPEHEIEVLADPERLAKSANANRNFPPHHCGGESHTCTPFLLGQYLL